MSLAALALPPSLDAKQALRLRRLGVAALSYGLAMALVAVALAFGMLPAAAALQASAAFVAINLGVYAVIRSGINLRLKDPSLTRFQVIAAVTILMFIVYRMDDGRDIALFACFFVFLFGIFRLKAREFTLVTLYTLAAYALVINLLMYWRPQAIHDVPTVWISWLILAGILPWFSVVSGQINALRRNLRDSEARFRGLTAMSSDFYWESDAEDRLSEGNSPDNKASTATVFRRGAQIGERIWEIPSLSPDETGWRAHRAMRDAHLPFRGFEFSRLGTDGSERHMSISGDAMFDASGAFKGYRGVGTDITAHKLAQERIQRVAHHDSLTGLPNRLLFNDRLEQAISLAKRHSGQFALLYLDLDNFKPVNDTLGHTAGDDLLKSVAARIRQQVRESDTVARIGGDEFAVILSDIAERATAQIVVRKIMAALAAPFLLGSPKQNAAISASVGIALYPADAGDADALVKAADADMYSVKQARISSHARAA